MSAGPAYQDRRHAGRVLAVAVETGPVGPDPLVLALPRGGVPVGREVALRLSAPLEPFVVRKLGLPQEPELAMGAIASGGVRVLDEHLIAAQRVTPAEVQAVTEREMRELARREARYRGDRPFPSLTGRAVIVVDDGLATGFTLRAAVKALRRAGVGWIAAAVPVGAQASCEELGGMVDRLVCPLQPEYFPGVGYWYGDFRPTSDEEVLECLAAARRREPAGERGGEG